MKKIKTMISTMLSVILLFFYITPVYAQEVEKILPSGVKYKNIGNEIETFVKANENTTAGMGITVFDREGIIYKNYFGYGDREKGYVADDETVFEWGSVSKLLIWVSVMQLWEQGKIDLEEDIKTYLPDGFLTNLKYDKPITMINLMNHNAGFEDVICNLYLKDIKNVNSLANELQKHKPEQIYEPGTVTAYSNWSSALAGYIVERISGKSYSQYVKENIFKPLGMEHTAIAVDLSDNQWVVKQRKKLQCYTVDGKLIPQCFYYISLYPAGMCTGTLSDLTKFAQALLPRNGQKSPLFKKNTTLHEILSPTSFYGDTNIPLNCHGYWTREYGVSVLGHGGNTAGCSANLLFDIKSGVATIVMTNQKYENVYNYDIMNLIFGSFKKSKYASYNKTVPSGFFMNSRRITKGPLAMSSILGISKNSEKDLESFWLYYHDNEISKIVGAYGEVIKLSIAECIVIGGLLVFMTLGIIYSFAMVIYGICIFIPVKLGKKRKQSLVHDIYPFRKWNFIACILEVLLVVNIGLLFYQVASYAPSSKYIWQFGINGIIAIFMVTYIIHLIISWKKLGCNRKEKGKYVITGIFMLASVIFILYYHMYKFWAF